jgi:transposase
VLPNYGYAKKGIRIDTALQPSSWKKRSLLMSICSDGTFAYIIIDGSVKKNLFLKFVDEIALNDDDALLLDNVPFHHSNQRPFYVFTPPYQPKYNPIEYAFSKIKNHFRKITNRTNFQKSIEESISTTTAKDITNYFDHVLKLVQN